VARSEEKYRATTALLMAGLSGDEAAYARFLRDISPLLRRVIGRRVAARDVEDVLQEVLISVHKARHSYDGARPLMPWLMAIASFRITDYLRKSYATMRHQTVDIAEVEHTLADVTAGDGLNESIHGVLREVPETQKQILTMMHVEGYTAKQVGARLGMNESAVKVAAHRAIKKLRERFK
jgi:RNA polymerase sigma-70 factor (ECF subfamily)